MASYTADRNNYADAAQYSNQVFDGLLRVITNTEDGTVKQQLQSILARSTPGPSYHSKNLRMNPLFTTRVSIT